MEGSKKMKTKAHTNPHLDRLILDRRQGCSSVTYVNSDWRFLMVTNTSNFLGNGLHKLTKDDKDIFCLTALTDAANMFKKCQPTFKARLSRYK